MYLQCKIREILQYKEIKLQINLYFEIIFTFDPVEQSNSIYHFLQISS